MEKAMKYFVIIFLIILSSAVKLMQSLHITTTERVNVITAVSDTNDVSDDAATIDKYNNSGSVVITTKYQQSIWLVHLYNMMIETKQRLQENVIKRGFGQLKESDNGNTVDSLPMPMPLSDGDDTKNPLGDEGNNTADSVSHVEMLQFALMLVMLVMNFIILVTVFTMLLSYKCRNDDADIKVIAIGTTGYHKV